MKKVYFTLFFFVAFSLAYSQKDILGKWKAACLVEKVDSTSIRYCELCATKKKIDLNTSTIDFELNFGLTDVTILVNGYTTIKEYDWDKGQNLLEFHFKDKAYRFNILWTKDPKQVIFKNDDNTILFLTKR